MTKIIGFAGKKQSGKTTATKAIVSWSLLSLNVIQQASFGDNGELMVYTDDGEGILDVSEKTTQDWMKNTTVLGTDRKIADFVNIYYFADDLKQKVCMDILGLTYEQCYGTDEHKNSQTNYRWDQMPGNRGRNKGNMTAREIMQFVGTKIFRCIDSDVWVNSCIRRIAKESPDIAIIGDIRFPNEVLAVQDAGGKVIKLTRHVCDDNDESEIALDKFDKFDYVLDNSAMDIGQQNEATAEILKTWGYFE